MDNNDYINDFKEWNETTCPNESFYLTDNFVDLFPKYSCFHELGKAILTRHYFFRN